MEAVEGLGPRKWPMCDDTWGLRGQLLKELRYRQALSQSFLHLADMEREYLERLPHTFMVFRGCDRRRVMDVSWTTNLRVAQAFARGHRSTRVKNPIVATGVVAKAGLFGIILSSG